LIVYLGLVNEHGEEITNKDYHRICLDEIPWAMLPSNTRSITFTNLQAVSFHAASNWGLVRGAVFFEVIGGPLAVILAGALNFVVNTQTLCFDRGALQFDTILDKYSG
jgi:hypothetical protein